MAVRGGLTRCARPSGSLLAGSSFVQLAAPLLSPSLGLAPSGPEQALFKNAPGVFVPNPGRWFSSPLGLGDTYKQKARTSVQALNLNMAVRGGLTRFARPSGQPVRCAPGLSNWLRRYSAHPWASPLRGQSKLCSKTLPAFLCRTPVGGSHPPLVWGIHISKKPVLSYELFLKYGGEGGIRTPDTLPYTHFPGVLLQPLGHLTILYCCLTTWGATGRYYRELR